MKKSTLVLPSLFLIILAGAAAQNRTALLVANGNYANFGKLATPVLEARALKAALENLGFRATLVENASREAMVDALADFETSLRSRGGIAFFHYGGHGVQVGGKNYLIPSNAEIPDEKRVASRCVDLDEVMAALDSGGAETSIVVLDACRNNPLPAQAGRSASRGLAVIGAKPRNSIIVYAAESGNIAQDGLFTPALTRALGTPGLDLSQVVMQVRREVYEKSKGAQTPGAYDQLFAPVYLAGAAAAKLAAQAEPHPAPTLTMTGAYGSLAISTASAGALYVDGKRIGDLPAGVEARLDGIESGEHRIELRYAGDEVEAKVATIKKGEVLAVAFNRKRPGTPPAEGSAPTANRPAYDSIPRAGLVGEYLLDGDAKDTSGKGNDGKMTNAMQGRNRFDRSGGSLAFDGRSSVIEVPNSPSLDLKRSYSISFWMNPDGSQQGAAIISKNTEGNDQFFVAFAFRDKLGMEQNNRGKWYYASAGFRIRAWNHICVVVEENRISLYINGARDPGSPFERIVGQRNAMPLLIGASGRSSGASRYFSGLLDDIRVYDRALSEPDILSLYHEGGWAGN